GTPPEISTGPLPAEAPLTRELCSSWTRRARRPWCTLSPGEQMEVIPARACCWMRWEISTAPPVLVEISHAVRQLAVEQYSKSIRSVTRPCCTALMGRQMGAVQQQG